MSEGTILAVDDESVTLDIIRDALEDAKFSVVTAVNGRQALEILMADPDRFDAVVVDRSMPELDGMAVLSAVRANFGTTNIPVILQTAEARSEQMREGVEAGAFYYITKPYDEETLVAIVRSAVESRRQQRTLMDYISLPLEAAHPLVKGEFRISTPKEAQSVAWMISQHAEQQGAVAIGLLELTINAIEHGNLGIGGPEKERLVRQNRWGGEVQRRLELPENAKKTVAVTFDATGEDVVVSIEDHGEGFDWTHFLGDTPDVLNKVSGRGIAKARGMATFASYTYNNAGRCAVVTFTGDHD